ncbi:MAG: hypothetical protein WA667_25090 [Candidatus Nitrosopolaris sp.]
MGAEKQIDWHSRKAQYNKIRFSIYQIITLIGQRNYPNNKCRKSWRFSNTYDIFNNCRYNSGNNWTNPTRKVPRKLDIYRTSSELLKKEKYFFENSVGEYSNPDEKERNKLLVERVESIVSAKTSKYFTIHQPSQKNNKNRTKNNKCVSSAISGAFILWIIKSDVTTFQKSIRILWLETQVDTTR